MKYSVTITYDVAVLLSTAEGNKLVDYSDLFFQVNRVYEYQERYCCSLEYKPVSLAKINEYLLRYDARQFNDIAIVSVKTEPLTL